MGEESARFRRRAEQCRELAARAHNPQDCHTLIAMAEDLEAEAGRLEGEEGDTTSTDA